MHEFVAIMVILLIIFRSYGGEFFSVLAQRLISNANYIRALKNLVCAVTLSLSSMKMINCGIVLQKELREFELQILWRGLAFRSMLSFGGFFARLNLSK